MSTSPPPPPGKLNSSTPKPLQSQQQFPSPWSHTETLHLIQTYQEKWYSLNRGQLKSHHWDDVSLSVAARCGSSKTATQCRHKIEKLRKRYRSEKLKPNPGGTWDYFDLMLSLELGPIPHKKNPNDDIDEEEVAADLINFANYNELPSANKNTRSPSYPNYDDYTSIRRISKPRSVRVQENHGYMQIPRVKRKREERFESSDDDSEDIKEGPLFALAGEIRTFAERFVKMEKTMMEMMKETQRYRMEMENKRIEMMVESQRKIVDSISRAFGSAYNKKMKMGNDGF